MSIQLVGDYLNDDDDVTRLLYALVDSNGEGEDCPPEEREPFLVLLCMINYILSYLAIFHWPIDRYINSLSIHRHHYVFLTDP